MNCQYRIERPISSTDVIKTHIIPETHNITILFGGMDSTGYNRETWIYNHSSNTWTQMNPSTKPSPRNQHSMVYDSTHNIVILFGGVPNLDDTWIYNYSNDDWTNMNPSTKPSGRVRHSMVYDPVNDVVILFGGSPSNDETWIYNYTANTWTMLNPSTKPSQLLHRIVLCIAH
ncbi:hypothetical protein LCGC14_1161590 [marine sediment metagenome]|uniref:Galactose oxidase-like Early set domain-containing protein n=1 Tax=marine sediment metagenome TaxID=412755 RepID=A0A0F9LSB7_9ZZZZ